tara:strand:+ start:1109 stop:1459 length:351 start_codon:yes stop_codon:yes gene_type:complete
MTTHTVTLLADHLGSTAPRVMGHEYVVDVCVDSTNLPSGGVVVTAAECGLSTVSCVVVTGAENPNHYVIQPVIVAETGAYESASSFKLHYADDLGSASTTSDTNVGSVRVRVWGLI